MTSVAPAAELIQQGWAYEIEPLGSSVTRSLDEEGKALVRDFGGVSDWRTLSSSFIDQAPDGMASALSFFSDAAICYFIAGFLLADINGELVRAEPFFHLTHGFDAAAYGGRYGGSEADVGRWQGLTSEQAEAIVAYLETKRSDDLNAPQASAALNSFWYARAGTLRGDPFKIAEIEAAIDGMLG